MPEKEIIIEIAIERLRDFPGSPFKVTMDEPMSDLIESIQTYGILTPLIVRPIPEGCYQIISGHRRRFAAAKLRYRKVPVIIRAMNDDEALIAMVDSNLQREKIRISEKAFAYRMKYDVVKREGKHPKEYFYGEKYRGMKTIEFTMNELTKYVEDRQDYYSFGLYKAETQHWPRMANVKPPAGLVVRDFG